MKYFIAAFFLLLPDCIFAQKPFQGTIIYSLYATGDEKNAELTAMFTTNKVKLKLKEKEVFDKTYVIIDLDSGKVFTLNTENKTYKVTRLVEQDLQVSTEQKTIAGFSTVASQINSTGKMGILSQIIGGSATLYTSKDLYFPVHQKFAGNPELIFINNNHIVLGARIKINRSFDEEENELDTLSHRLITVEAQLVATTPVNKEEFLIPMDYSLKKKQIYDYDDSYATDTAVMMMDSLISTQVDTTIIGKKPAIKSKTKPATPKKTNTAKGEAIKKKKT